MVMDELVSGSPAAAHERYYRDFFTIKEMPVRGIKVSYNEDAIAEHKRSFTGWFVMISNDVKDKMEALEIYRQKDASTVFSISSDNKAKPDNAAA